MSTTNIISHYLSLINQCINTKNLKYAQPIHSHLLKLSLTSHTLLSNRLTYLYSKLGSPTCTYNSFIDLPFKNTHSYNSLLSSVAARNISQALKLFDEIPDRNLVSYNTILSSLTQHGNHKHALEVFRNMPKYLHFDRFTIVGVASACVGLEELRGLKQVHGFLVVNGMHMNLIMCNVFVDGYGKCRDVELARRVFDVMKVRDVVSWTSLIGGYMRSREMEEARRVFDMMPEKNSVSWTALISGYEQNGEEEKAIELFEEMVENGIKPTPFTLVSVLSSYARLGLIGRGKQVHAYIVRRVSFVNVFTYNVLIDMYAKCGDMESALAIFDLMVEHDAITWNSMITGFAQNGLAMQALEMFDMMTNSRYPPTQVTFLGVLSACSHAGLVSEGRRFLNLMENKYGVCPKSEHYAAFVDTLGRNRQLGEATKLIESLSFSNSSNNAGVWGALLGACQVHGDLELGKIVAEKLLSLEPENGVRYATLSNIYASAGKWDEAKRVRVVMKKKGLRKDGGFSWIEVKSVKNVFGAGDISHSQTAYIYGMLHVLFNQMRGEKIDDFFN